MEGLMRRSAIRNMIFIAIVILLFSASGKIANFIIEYNWWKEVEQVDTWMSMLLYQIAPGAAGTLLVFIVLWLAHTRGLQFAGIRAAEFTLYRRLVPVGLLGIAALVASGGIDYWVVMSYAGSRGITLPRSEERRVGKECRL